METSPGPLPSGEESLEAVDLYLGKVLAERYRLVKCLGRGGMGAVYEAEHLLIGRRVAVKVLYAQHACDAAVVRRFMNEARASAQLDHPHILESTDMGRAPDGAPFIVFELLSGHDLEHEITEVGPLSIPRAVLVALQVASALGAAHAQGIIHRDLKPANVFLSTRSGARDHVKVLDFGISKFISGAGIPGHTAAGTVLGTPHYLPPECLQEAATIDTRVDIYALGVLLFQMLTGLLPFEAPTLPALFQKIHGLPPTPLTSLRHDVPEGLVQVIERALAKDPAERFPTMEAMSEALQPYAALPEPDQAAELVRPSRPVLADAPPTLLGLRASGPRIPLPPGGMVSAGGPGVEARRSTPDVSGRISLVSDDQLATLTAADQVAPTPRRPRRRLVPALGAALALLVAGVTLATWRSTPRPARPPARPLALVARPVPVNPPRLIAVPGPAPVSVPTSALPDASAPAPPHEDGSPRSSRRRRGPPATTATPTPPAPHPVAGRRPATGGILFQDHPDF